MVQLHGRQVDRHAQLGHAAVVPDTQLTTGLVQHPFTDFNDAAVLLSQRYEQIRWYQPAFWMVPAQQGFHTNYAVIVIGDLWLVDEVEFVALQRSAQLLVEFPAYAHFAVEAGDVELVAIP